MALYILCTARFLRSGYSVHTRRVIGLLACIQVLVIIFDAMLWSLVFTNRLQAATIIQPLTQAIKLKLEFIILNQLQRLVKPGGSISDLDIETGLQPSVTAGTHLDPSRENNRNSLQESRPSVTTISATPKMPLYSNGNMQSSTDGSTGICVHDTVPGVQDADEILQGNKRYTKRFIGRPGEEENDIDALEALYLGKWVDE
jgi:hypothetical protein